MERKSELYTLFAEVEKASAMDLTPLRAIVQGTGPFVDVSPLREQSRNLGEPRIQWIGLSVRSLISAACCLDAGISWQAEAENAKMYLHLADRFAV